MKQIFTVIAAFAFVARMSRHMLAGSALVFSLMLAPPALSATPNEMINIIAPVGGAGTSTQCGAFCFAAIGCCDPQSILDTAYQRHRNNFILGSFFRNTADKDFKRLSDQLTQTWALKAATIGGFYDAQNLSTAQANLQRLQAESSRSYITNQSICQFGTLARSLGATTEKTRANQILLNEINLARNSGKFNSIGSTGRGQDNWYRMNSFIETMCDNSQNNSAMSVMCASGVSDARFNRDIDYARTLATPETLRVDFTNNGVTTTEHDLISLGRNLYGTNQFIKRIGRYDLQSGSGQLLYSLMRSVTAKRAVAQNSFNAYAAMKSMGTTASRQFMDSALSNLGMNQRDRDAYMANIPANGGTAAQPGNPSYYAQMDILTKRIFQNPTFYSELMTNPANVSRQQAAMESLGLMQGRDMFTSMSRSEQLLAVLVEMEAIKLQSKVQNNAKPK